ncbi:MAG: MFS transporter [Planctomycetota bacterium]
MTHRSKPEWEKTVRVLFFANLTTATGMMAMVPFLTFFVEELGIHEPHLRNLWAGVLVGAAPIVAALLGPIWGGLSDRFGRKVMVLRAMGAIVIFVGLMSFATSVWTMLALRVMQGAFSGYIPTSITFASVIAPQTVQGQVAARLQSAMPAGMVGGYLLGGFLSEAGLIRWIFPICSVLSGVAFFAVLFFTKEPEDGALSAARGPVEIMRGIWNNAIFVLHLPNLMKLLMALIIVRFLVSTVDPSYARFVVELGGDKQFAGIVMSVQALMVLIMMPIWGRFSDREGPSRTFVLSALGVAVAYGLQGLATSPWQLLFLRAMAGAFLSGVFPAGFAMAGRESPRDKRGAAMGIVFMAFAMAHALGSVSGGYLLNLAGFRQLFFVIAVVVGLLSLTGFYFRRRGRGAPKNARAGS